MSFFLWEIFVNLLTCASYSFLLLRRLGRPKKGIIALVLGTMLHWIVISIINYFDINLSWTIVPGVNIYFNRFITMILVVTLAVVVFNGELSKRMLWGLVPIPVTAIADYITCLIATGILNATFEDAIAFGSTRFLLTVSFALMVIISCLALSFIANRKSKSGIHIPVHTRALLIVMLIIGTLTVDVLIDNAFAAAASGVVGRNIVSSIAGVVILLLIIMAFILVVQIGFLSQKNLNYALEIRQKKLEHEYYHNLEIVIDSIQKFKHDMQSHTQIMHGLLRQKAYSELEEYFETVDEKFRRMPRMYLTANNTINALLVSKAVIAETEAIPFHYRANDSLGNVQFASLQYYDLCSVLGNLLDNAIDACRKLEASERYIDLTIEKRLSMLIIHVKNSCNGKYQKVKNSYLSDKTGAGHGIGLNNIGDVVAKCGGNLMLEPSDTAFIATVFIPLITQET